MGLTTKQNTLAKLLGRFTDTRTKAELAKAAGFSENRVYQLQHEPEFMAVVQAEADKHRTMLLLECDRSLWTLVRRGDVRAIDLAYKRCGVIQSGSNQVVNVNQNAGQPFEDRLQEAFAGRNRIAEKQG